MGTNRRCIGKHLTDIYIGLMLNIVLQVLIDRGTPIGFSNIARARQWILDSEGINAHVVAPVSIHNNKQTLVILIIVKL